MMTKVWLWYLMLLPKGKDAREEVDFEVVESEMNDGQREILR